MEFPFQTVEYEKCIVTININGWYCAYSIKCTNGQLQALLHTVVIKYMFSVIMHVQWKMIIIYVQFKMTAMAQFLQVFFFPPGKEIISTAESEIWRQNIRREQSKYWLNMVQTDYNSKIL